MKKSADFSADRVYRYALYRVWDEALPLAMFVGLNPSTADEVEDDRTICRCINFSKSWGYGGLIMANLFAYRSKDPSKLNSAPNNDPIGPENNDWIIKLQSRCKLVLIAWGTNGALNERNKAVLKLLDSPYCLGITKHGHPRHPLYVRGEIKPIEFGEKYQEI
ncbi:MAG: DUF1643 domain-containing protein [Pseudomonadota bacterium]